jgi:signal transduction histidine kinase
MGVRARLTLAFGAGMAAVLLALGAFLYVRLGTALLQSVEAGLRSRAQDVAAIVAGGDVRIPDTSTTLIDPDESVTQVLDPGAAEPVLFASAAVTGAPLVPVERLSPLRQPTFLTAKAPGLEDNLRLLVVPVDAPAGTRYVVLGATLSDREEALDRFLAAFAVGGTAALAISSVAGWLVAGGALRPVARMRAEASAISALEPDRRLPVPSTQDELARLASTLNGMLDRLQEAMARERRFVDDASHELRTPLGVLKAELDVALARARTPEELEETLRRASAETDRLAGLAEDLLVLARASDGRLPIRREAVSPAAVVDEACRARARAADAAGVALEADVPADPVRIDAVRCRQALENLLDNAIRHSPRGGTVRVTGEQADHRLAIVVADDGPGFPDHFLGDAFEPFSRADRDHDGAGLGLAIARAVAEGHGGRATASNRPEGGARVELTFRIDGPVGAVTAERSTAP